MQYVMSSKGFLSQCHTMLLENYLEGNPCKVSTVWEKDVGAFEEDQWEVMLQSVQLSSLNVSHQLSQLYILLRVHYTPVKLHAMGRRQDSIYSKCKRNHRDLIHMLWQCPKLHRYWESVVDTLNSVLQTTIKLEPK